VKAGSTATSDWNCRASLRLFERRKRHGLGGNNANKADSDGYPDRKKFVHSFLPQFVTRCKRSETVNSSYLRKVPRSELESPIQCPALQLEPSDF
jgi:hypothetical protein